MPPQQQRSISNAVLGFHPDSPQAAIARFANRKRRKRFKAPRDPRTAYLSYAQGILRLLQPLEENARTMLLPALRHVFARRPVRLDADADIGGLVRAQMVASPRPRAEAVRNLAKTTALQVGNHVERQLSQQFGYAPTSNPLANSPRLEKFIIENTDLIDTLPERYALALQDQIEEAYDEGETFEQLQGTVSNLSSVIGAAILLIATDQIRSLSADVQQTRVAELGVQQYTWRTVRDERVRDEHAHLEGQVFDYEGEGDPEEGHPGDAINCRCYAEPLLGGDENATNTEL